jgi:hypothetical protein
LKDTEEAALALLEATPGILRELLARLPEAIRSSHRAGVRSTSNLEPPTAHLTPHTSHLTPHTSHLSALDP